MEETGNKAVSSTMGPFQEYEEKKSPEKGSPRSRIPRLVLHRFRPKDKGSPLSDSLLSEEDGKECDISSEHSKRTISTNSFCSDDTGCPTSQSVSPSKTPSGSERSPHGSPTLPERKTKVKRVRVMAASGGEACSTPRHKRELRSALRAQGSEADFSSSSSTGSLKTKEILTSSLVGKKASSRCHGPRIRMFPVFKPAGVPSVKHDSELYAPYRTPPRAASSTLSSSCNSSPTNRRVTLGRYHSCGDNHGIRPPNPEQYLTPLQQKEVNIRHLKTKLLESENKVHDRENEIGELKAQLCRMREDWIEEECHRVEAQLSLKEARKEIRQLRQVVETMKNSLMEKDKGIQKYFIDINIQNRKLESLLHSMELAQSGSTLQDEGALDFMCDRSEGDKKLLGEEESGMELGNAGAEAMADSGLLVNDEMANREDIFEQVFISNAVDFSQDSVSKPKSPVESGAEKPALSEEGQLVHASTPPPASPPVGLSSTVIISSSPSYHQKTDKEVQTNLLPISPDLQALLQLLKFHGASLGDAALTAPSSLLDFPILPTSKSTVDQSGSERLQPSILGGPNTSTDTSSSDLTKSSRFMEELDFGVQEEKPFESASKILVDKSYWSSNFLVDLVAVAAPVLPTVAWLYSRHGVDGSTPVYNIGALIRGCCIMGLHSLRHVTRRPNT
ncbi:syntabulin isoform X2 [Girardinichthys multiradiatus]|uniref:syntabulin isoform X2 n=1 Tax=Girardinichthys multiradiatus TaxID=208333 RepID=UPI001FAB63E2|nr:syntabulin isoform X2 [Girardinichthys multiradiatus]XP_047216895.1 syntabulin isoform X2 [Girardinichthys multiradiatus]XP_047216896.1 syntabulin isoform X2 [Girardinichthys multiradiatus]